MSLTAMELNQELQTLQTQQLQAVKKQSSFYRKILFPSLLFVLLCASYLPLFASGLLKHKVLEIIIRGVLIVLVWRYVLLPLMMKWMRKWLQQYQRKEQHRLQEIIQLLPEIKNIVKVSWQQAAAAGNRLGRFGLFVSNTATLIVHGR
jgi:hypothetical protein